MAAVLLYTGTQLMTALVAFQSDLAAHNLRTEVFGLISNVSENLRSGFLALGFFTGIDGPD